MQTASVMRVTDKDKAVDAFATTTGTSTAETTEVATSVVKVGSQPATLMVEDAAATLV